MSSAIENSLEGFRKFVYFITVVLFLVFGFVIYQIYNSLSTSDEYYSTEKSNFQIIPLLGLVLSVIATFLLWQQDITIVQDISRLSQDKAVSNIKKSSISMFNKSKDFSNENLLLPVKSLNSIPICTDNPIYPLHPGLANDFSIELDKTSITPYN